MNKAIPILIVTTAVPAIACLHLVRELREERTQIASLQAKVAELQKAATASQVFTVLPRATPFSAPVEPPSDIQRNTQPPAASNKSPDETSGTRVAGAALAPDPRERMREHLERRREMMKNPEYRDAIRARTRLGMHHSYPGLAAELDMTDDEAERFLDLLADQQVREMDQHEPMFMADNGDEAAMREAQERFQQRAQQQQAEIEMHLGPARYQQWQEYQQTLGQRHRLAAVQSKLALGGSPLNAEQSQALLSALVQEQRKQQAHVATNSVIPAAIGGNVVNAAGVFPGHEEWLKQQEQSNERLLAAVKSSLTSQQFSQLEEMLNSELELQRTHLKLQQAQGTDPVRSFSRGGALRVVAPSYGTQVVVESSLQSTEAN